MADFRKLVLALAVLALIAVPASAQNVMQCSAIAGSGTPLVRAEGLAELVGDTVLSCVGNASTANIQIFFNTNVTNRLQSDNTLFGTQLTVDGAPVGTTGVGTLVNNRSVLWTNVSIPATSPTATTHIVRITGIRADATTIPVSTTFGFSGTIQEFISVTSTVAGSAVSVFPSTVDVAIAGSGLTFTRNKTLTFQQCTGNLPSASNVENLGKISPAPANTFTLTYAENFPSAFKTFASEGAGATNATRLFARFTNVPAGARIFVTNLNTAGTGVAGVVDADGAVAGTQGYTQVNPDSTGTAYVEWEVTTSNDTVLDTLTFGVIVSIPANISFTGGTSATAQVAGGFAPLSNVNVATKSTTVPIPRFVDRSTPTDLFNIAACVTNLLFPYVTNQAGFDTGIAIVNTSKDTGVFNTTPQSGTCTVYYFGAMGNSAQVPGPQTTASVDAGQMVTFLLSTGGVTGATQSAATFQGYLIARCNFQYAHGFAFISGQGIGSVAQGYLALIIPDTTTAGTGRAPSPFTAAGSSTGEQLAM